MVWVTIGSGMAIRKFEEPEFEEKYGTLVEGLNKATTIGRYWNVLIFVR
jgi:hypothetical protein